MASKSEAEAADRRRRNDDLVTGFLEAVQRVEGFVGLAGVAGDNEDLAGHPLCCISVHGASKDVCLKLGGEPGPFGRGGIKAMSPG